jgi:hypothetical protein
MDRFRFVTYDGSTLRLDLNTESGWMLARGFVLGNVRLERTYITQPPYAGGTLASSWKPVVQMTVPLILTKQTNIAAIRTKFDALKTELERDTNTIEMRENGDNTSYYIDTYKADMPSLHRGIDAPNLMQYGVVIGPIVLEIDRYPDLRGAGTMI